MPTLVLQRQNDDDYEGIAEMFSRADAEELLANYQKIDPRMERFAKRLNTEASDFSDDRRSGAMEALSLPRAPDGSLTPEAIRIMLELQAEQAHGYMDQAAKATILNPPTSKAERKALVKQLKTHDPNKVTGATRLPELLDVAKDKTAGEATISHEQIAGTRFQIFHNTRDGTYKPRLGMVKEAAKRIVAAGFTLPNTVKVHLPRLGRTIDASTLCESGGTPRAVFNPPNFIHISPAVVRNPIDTTIGDDYKNLSTTLDPKGPATVIHEMGHMLHYQNDSSRFFGLHLTTNTQKGGSISNRVSAYAVSSPREFVAEVFLGLIYERTWDDEVLEMYDAYGGAISDKIRARVDKARAKEARTQGH